VTIIIKDTGREIILPERTGQVILNVLNIMVDLERVPVGQLKFHLKGRNVVYELSEIHRPRPSPELTRPIK
jgi:hypothetical protein